MVSTRDRLRVREDTALGKRLCGSGMDTVFLVHRELRLLRHRPSVHLRPRRQLLWRGCSGFRAGRCVDGGRMRRRAAVSGYELFWLRAEWVVEGITGWG